MCSSWGLKENTVHSSACCKITRACVLGVNNPTQSAAGCAGGRLPHAPSLMAAPLLGQNQNPTAYCRTPPQKCNRTLFRKRGLSLGSSVQKALSFICSGAIFWLYYFIQACGSLLEVKCQCKGPWSRGLA